MTEELRESSFAAQACTCPQDHFSPTCPWARHVSGMVPLGHVRACPVSGLPCPCATGSTSHTMCKVDAGLALMTTPLEDPR